MRAALPRPLSLPRRPDARGRRRAPRQGQEGRAGPEKEARRRGRAGRGAGGHGEGAVRRARGARVSFFLCVFFFSLGGEREGGKRNGSFSFFARDCFLALSLFLSSYFL